jgi:hypothetical protein
MRVSAVKRGVVVGALGCLGAIALFAVVGFSALYYFGNVQRGGVYDDLRSKLNQSQMTSLYPQIEIYKIQHGVYPDSLTELVNSLPKGSPIYLYDASASVSKEPQKFREFYYARVGCDHYYLRSAGLDAIPFTPDDDLPIVEAGAGSKLGLLVRRNLREPKACSAP